MSDDRPGALVGVEKPSAVTSHDVVSRVRRALGLRRVGHAGTLDPMATGVLILGLGQATRLLGLVTLSEKSYLVEVAFGSETSTDDAEGDVVATGPVPEACRDRSFAERRVAALAGRSLQVPPDVSAVKRDGRRAYRAARAGEPLALEPREVEVLGATLIAVEDAGGEVRWTLALRVSKGFYVRSLARDLGREFGCGAHVARLERTCSGPVGLGQCLSLDDLDEAGWALVRAHALDPLALAGLTARELTARELSQALSGRPLPARAGDGPTVGLVRDGRLWGVWERRGGALSCKANLPDGVLLGPDAPTRTRGK